MSDNNFFQKSINVAGAANSSVSAAGSISAAATVVSADTSGGAYTLLLPDQGAAAGQTITVVNIDGTNILTVGVQTGDSLGGVVDATSAGLAVALDFQMFASTGAGGWVKVA